MSVHKTILIFVSVCKFCKHHHLYLHIILVPQDSERKLISGSQNKRVDKSTCTKFHSCENFIKRNVKNEPEQLHNRDFYRKESS